MGGDAGRREGRRKTAHSPFTTTGARPLLLGTGWDRAGGLTRYLRDLHDNLAAVGAAPRVVVLGPATQAPDSLVVAGLETDPLVRRLLAYARVATREGRCADVVDAHFALYAFVPVVLGGLRRKPLVVHFHGPWAEESMAAGERQSAALRAKLAVERRVYRRADRLVVLSHAFATLLAERYGVDPGRIEVIRPGVDLDRFSPAPSATAPSRTVFCARRLVPRMGLDVLVQAWSRVDRRPGDVLLVAGEGPSRTDLETQAAALGLDDSVRFLGRISDEELVERYRSANVTVLPSLSLEGFGLAALESLACGTPVVVTDAGGLPEVIADLDPSLVVPAGDQEALARRLSAALDGDVPSAVACRSHAETFSWSRAATQNAEVYAAAVAARRRDARAPMPSGGRRLRVVYLDHCAELSGAEIALARLLPALTGVQAHVVLAQDGPLRERLLDAGATVEVLAMPERARNLKRGRVAPARLPVRSVVDVSVYVMRLALRLRRLRPDLVHTNSLKSALYGGVAGRLAGVPLVWHARDRIADDYLPGAAVRVVRQAVRRLPAAVVANSLATLATLDLPAGGPRATVIADPFAPRAPVAAAGPREPRRGLRVGMVGRLAEWKGQHVFLEAMAKARPDGEDRAVLIGSAMFGEDAYELRLRRLAADLGIADRVDLLGFRPDVEVELADLDVLVHASVIPEPFGQVVVEGMALGLPVVASAAGGPAEIIDDGIDGLLVDPGDVDGLAAALSMLLDDADLRARLGAAAAVRARDFSPAVIGPQFHDVYLEVLS